LKNDIDVASKSNKPKKLFNLNLFNDLFLDQVCECPVPVLRAAAGGDALHTGVFLAPGKHPPPPPHWHLVSAASLKQNISQRHVERTYCFTAY
jgi:hypothetical protein